MPRGNLRRPLVISVYCICIMDVFLCNGCESWLLTVNEGCGPIEAFEQSCNNSPRGLELVWHINYSVNAQLGWKEKCHCCQMFSICRYSDVLKKWFDLWMYKPFLFYRIMVMKGCCKLQLYWVTGRVQPQEGLSVKKRVITLWPFMEHCR